MLDQENNVTILSYKRNGVVCGGDVWRMCSLCGRSREFYARLFQIAATAHELSPFGEESMEVYGDLILFQLNTVRTLQ